MLRRAQLRIECLRVGLLAKSVRETCGCSGVGTIAHMEPKCMRAKMNETVAFEARHIFLTVQVMLR
eukprot:2424270-Amphidinium_carterae.1